MKLCPKCQKEFSDDANFCPVCASRLLPAAAPAEADTLAARFDLGVAIGGNRTGRVFRAKDKTTGQAAAVKVVDRAVLALPGVAQRLERELKQLERVHSPGVAQVVASGRKGDDWWIATELLDGAQTLAEAIAARGPIPAEQAAELVEVIGEALIEAAQVGVVHRDLAPKNVLFAGDQVKLINFPLPVPTSEKVPGVAEFVAPEQVDGRPVDQRSNLYSLGALYYFVLTGETVFAGAAAAVHDLHKTGTIKPPSAIVGVPAPVEAAIMRALDRSPTKRFLTVRQFVDEVTRVGHGEVIELKQTMALGRANAGPSKPRGELVQTLMGFRGMGSAGVGATMQGAPRASAPAQAAAAAPRAPTPAPVAAPVVAAAATAAVSDGNAAKPLNQTVHGVPSSPAPLAPSLGGGMTPLGQPVAAVTAPVVAAPVVAAPVLAAPVVAAPVVAGPAKAMSATQAPTQPTAAAPAGKKRPADEAGSKGKFRETMWFKKGELDAQAAQAAAEEQARTGKVVDRDKADSLPMDERYKDDGSISRSDKEKYSLRTGATQAMAAMRDQRPGVSGKVSEDDLIGEMKGGRLWVLGAIVVGLVAIAAIVYMIAS